MAKFTLLELHLDDSTFTANAPFSSDADLPADGAGDGETTVEDADGGRPWLAALVGLLFLAVLAVLVKKKLGGDEEEYTDPEAAGFDD
jgi:hypothetical protein